MNPAIKYQHFNSPVGELVIGEYNGEIVLCDWRYRKMRKTIDQRITSALNTNLEKSTSPLIEQCIYQLNQYFGGERRIFDLPISLVGSDFQKQVWNELLKIPYGEKASYMDLAKKLNNEGAIRAVASANGANALSIIVPCHRIIGSDGDLTGYAGGLNAKKKLLELEGSLAHQTQLF